MSRSDTVIPAPTSSIRARALMLALAASLVALFAPASPAAAQSPWQIDGGGYGHGVGLSQYGACGMAAYGANYSQILSHYYQGAAVSNVTESDDLRVLLRTGSSFTLTTGGTTVINGTWTLPANSTVVATYAGGSVQLSGAISATVGAVFVDMGGSPLRVSPPGNRFNRGTLVVSAVGGKLQATVVGLTTNEFLRGLGEMPSSWPAEAMKAQAVAGRTIAQTKATRAGRWDSSYDLNALLDGAYIGYDKEYGTLGSAWTAAVDATNGKALTYGGALILAVYSSSSGGFTEHSENVWYSSLPYLRGGADSGDSGCNNPNFGWTTTLSAASMGQKLGMGPVTAITIGAGAGVSGRLDKVDVSFTDSGGTTRTFTGAQLRSKLGLKSTKFWINGASGSRSGGSGPPSGTLTDIRLHDGRNLLVAGTANDPDGAPRVVVATLFDGRIDMWVVDTVNGEYLDVHPVQPGKHTTCTAVMDVPTGQAVLLGCRENVVK
ncbi:MAG: SpoIID/LytB domain-containing protein [Microthrixaceae bacterium]